MADFCKACSDKLFGPDMPPDLGGITKKAEWEQGKAVAVLCEGCGPIQVDPEGNCVSRDCLCAGEPGHGYKCDAVFRITKDGRVTATLEAVGDGMPSQPDVKSARKKLAAYCRWLSVALNKNEKPVGNIPIF